ncbi:DoxX family protein [Acinetobacter sp. MD2(2019)]|uniref:DoxX family protein n=1 Tax=Acinetobacter sp. MD2(2019) TaxID=2605273 RepID=UPI002D1ECF72|nr:DoxX family protein [Acinetobacter sp. MD2(2019)]MEB3754811.1 DoxX family protein [Acinetobacter sp. MD2(2019)]
MNALRYLNFGSAQPLVLLIARLLLILLFVLFGVSKLTGFTDTIQYMQMLHAPLPIVSAAIAVFAEVFLGIAIIVGFYTRPAAAFLALYTIGTALIGHAYWHATGDMTQDMNTKIHFFKNISIAGGFLLLAVAGPGAISLDKK